MLGHFTGNKFFHIIRWNLLCIRLCLLPVVLSLAILGRSWLLLILSLQILTDSDEASSQLPLLGAEQALSPIRDAPIPSLSLLLSPGPTPGSPGLSCPQEPRTGHNTPDTVMSPGLSGGAGSLPCPAANVIRNAPQDLIALLAPRALPAQTPNRVPSTAGAVRAGAVRAFGRQHRTRSRTGVSAPVYPPRASVLTGQLPPAAPRSRGDHRRAAREPLPAPRPGMSTVLGVPNS